MKLSLFRCLCGALVGLASWAESPAAQASNFNQLLAQATAGDATAEYQVGEDYLHGTGIPRNYAQADAWLEKAAAQKNTLALSALGSIYTNGLGQPKDNARAFNYYLEGAEAGDPDCQRIVAESYHKGLGIKRDDSQSVEWYQKAAAQGDTVAQTALAIDLVNGTGIKKDPKQAFAYFLNAAYQGQSSAQYQVARCYSFGIFVPRDPILAYKWAKLSGESYVDRLIKDWLKTKLTDSEMGEARKLIKDWPREKQGDHQKDPLPILFANGTSAQFPFELLRNEIVIHVAVQNHPNLNFLVDTGAATSALDDSTASQLGIGKKGAYIPAVGTGSQVFLTEVVRDIHLDLPGLSLPDTSFSLLSLSSVSHSLGERMDGIIGFDLLKHFALQIDFTHKTIALISPSAFHPDKNQTVVKLNVGASALFAATTIFNQNEKAGPVDFEVDTGNAEAFTLSRNFIRNHANLNLMGSVSSEAAGMGGTSQEEQTKCSQINMGDILFKNPIIHLVQENQGAWVKGLAGMIGNEALRRFDLTIDFADKKLFYQRNASFNDPYDHSSTGLSVMATGADFKTLKVSGVSPGSPAAKAGFEAGDILEQIDGQDVGQLKLSDVRNLFIKEGDHQIVVQRGDQPVTLTFQMEDLLK